MSARAWIVGASSLVLSWASGASAGWGIAYERDAGDLRQAEPIVSADGSTVWSAGMEHALTTGRFRRLIALDALEALLLDGRGVVVEPERRVIVIAPIGGGHGTTVRARTRGIVGRVAPTADGRFVVAHEGRAIVVRRTRDLGVERVLATLAEDEEGASIEPLADGTVIVRRANGCDANGCALTRFAPEDGTTRALPWDARTSLVRTSADAGVVATLERGAHVVVVRDATSGTTVASLDPAPAHIANIAVAHGGDSLAVSTEQSLAIYRRDGARYALAASFVHRAPDEADGMGQVPEALVFSRDGAWLAAGGDSLLVLSRDATARRADAPGPYTPEVPAGFDRDSGDGERVVARRLSSGWTGTPRLLGRWERSSDATTVTAAAYDAAEMADFTLDDAWALAVVTRFVEVARDVPTTQLARRITVRRDAHGRRIVELLGIASGGCDPTDDYHRFVEDGAFLVHVELATYQPFAELGPLFTTFLDAPFRRDDRPDLAPSTPRLASRRVLGGHGCAGP